VHKRRTALAACVANADRRLAFQERSIEEQRAAAETLRVTRHALRDAAKAIVKIGKFVTLDETTMATMQILGSVSDDELLAYMRGLIGRVGPYIDAFVAEGLTPDLLKNMENQIQRFVAAKRDYAAARLAFTAASESIHETQAAADTIVEALEAIAVITPAARPEVLTKLRMAKRVGPRVVAHSEKPALSLIPAQIAVDDEAA